MKVPTILAVLAAIAMTDSIHAAPDASPSSAPAFNGTFSDDGADLLSRVVKYNYEGDAELARLYDEAMYGDSTIPWSNGPAKAAAVKNDVLPYCVGLSTGGPPRTRIFRNKITCDGNGFATLWTFTAHSKKDDTMASKPMCIAQSTINPSRSMYFPGKTTCDQKGSEWKTDFAFYESTQLHATNEMYQASNPLRMLMYPYYNGLAHGWEKSYSVHFRNFFRLAADHESKTLRSDFNSHLAVLKKIKVSAAPDLATYRCAEMLALSSEVETVPGNGGFTQSGKDLKEYANLAFNAKCNNLINSSSVVVRRVFVNGFGSVELNIGKNTVAAISMKVGHRLGAGFINRAILESLRTGQPVMVGVHDKLPNNGVTAYVQGKMIALGYLAPFWTAAI
ncbi:hypothetical protein BGZ97_000980 [Linnemannia gamsii]|uniref:Uncharacterized protein n=1 Tax=Linnemannia gamsii TaxID=64522 RepID=A0A9P6UJH7_9FUNG|nr:hypothetical protein BGZ97_000980 [Linnemannia gamsii]